MYAEFQFHKGSIKTNAANAEREEVLKFQFHKGSIKTMLSWHVMTTSAVSIP